MPADRTALKRFLGLLNYYRQFLTGFAFLVKPLTNMTSPKVPFSWTSECQAAFSLAKSALKKATSLALPVNSDTIRLSTNAINIGTSAVLEQMTDDCWWLLKFWSRNLNLTEWNYLTFNSKLLSVYLSMRHFCHLFTGWTFSVLSDH